MSLGRVSKLLNSEPYQSRKIAGDSKYQIVFTGIFNAVLTTVYQNTGAFSPEIIVSNENNPQYFLVPTSPLIEFQFKTKATPDLEVLPPTQLVGPYLFDIQVETQAYPVKVLTGKQSDQLIEFRTDFYNVPNPFSTFRASIFFESFLRHPENTSTIEFVVRAEPAIPQPFFVPAHLWFECGASAAQYSYPTSLAIFEVITSFTQPKKILVSSCQLQISVESLKAEASLYSHLRVPFQIIEVAMWAEATLTNVDWPTIIFQTKFHAFEPAQNPLGISFNTDFNVLPPIIFKPTSSIKIEFKAEATPAPYEITTQQQYTVSFEITNDPTMWYPKSQSEITFDTQFVGSESAYVVKEQQAPCQVLLRQEILNVDYTYPKTQTTVEFDCSQVLPTTIIHTWELKFDIEVRCERIIKKLEVRMRTYFHFEIAFWGLKVIQAKNWESVVPNTCQLWKNVESLWFEEESKWSQPCTPTVKDVPEVRLRMVYPYTGRAFASVSISCLAFAVYYPDSAYTKPWQEVTETWSGTEHKWVDTFMGVKQFSLSFNKIRLDYNQSSFTETKRSKAFANIQMFTYARAINQGQILVINDGSNVFGNAIEVFDGRFGTGLYYTGSRASYVELDIPTNATSLKIEGWFKRTSGVRPLFKIGDLTINSDILSPMTWTFLTIIQTNALATIYPLNIDLPVSFDKTKNLLILGNQQTSGPHWSGALTIDSVRVSVNNTDVYFQPNHEF